MQLGLALALYLILKTLPLTPTNSSPIPTSTLTHQGILTYI